MHIRCPHCHQPVELVDDVELEEVDCPSCGSHFSLLGEATAPHHAGGPRRLGRFELVDRLGVGRFGAVWLARDTELDRTVAIKIPRQEQLSPGDIEMFLREARAAAQLHHPNIVGVHEVGREGGTVYIVSDLIRGVTLADRLTAGRLSPCEACRLCAVVADALDHAHQLGVVHRDLKPSNIMLDSDEQPHLMDFGLAKREAAEVTMTLDGRILGTPAYMSPEQARGDAHRADGRSDVYSLGTILFELLTGHLPFRGNSRMLLMQILNDEPPSPRKIDAAVPRDLETICLKCLEKRPERRYATAHAVADELRHWLANQPILARPVGRPERAWRWCRRNPAVAFLSAAAMLSLAATAIVSTIAAYRLGVEQSYTTQNLRRAERAEHDALEKLRDSYLAQARAQRVSGTAGQRIGSLKALAEAAALRGGTDLRDEAIACLALTDLAPARRLPGQPSGTSALALDRPFTRYARSDGHGVLQIRSTADDRLLCELPSPGRAQHAWMLGFCTDGNYLAALHHPSALLHVWQWETKRLVFSHPISSGFEFHADGRRLACGNPTGGGIGVYDLNSGQLEDQVATGPPPFAFVYRPNGEQIAVTVAGPPGIALYDVKTHKRQLFLPASTDAPRCVITRMAWSRNGRLLAAARDDNQIHVYDLATGRLQAALRGHQAKPTDLAFNSRGDLLASSGWDGVIRLWDPFTGRQLLVQEGAGGYRSLAFSADDRLFGPTLSGRQVTLWSVAGGQRACASLCRPSANHKVSGTEFNRDGRLLATVDEGGGVHLWSVAAQDYLASLPITATSLEFDRSSDSLITAGSSGLHRWPIREAALDEIPDGEEICLRVGPPELLAPLKGLSCVSLDASGKIMAVAVPGNGQAVILREGRSNIAIERAEPNLRRVALSPDGRWLVTGTWLGGADSSPKLWNADTGKLERDLGGGEFSGDCAARFSEDGKWLAVSHGERQVRCWRVGSWGADLTLERDFRRLTEPDFSPDARMLAIAGSRDLVEFVDPATGSRLAGLLAVGPRAIDGMHFDPFGRCLAVRRTDLVQLWDLRNLRRELSALEFDVAGLGGEPIEAEKPLPTKVVIVGHDGSTTLWDESRRPRTLLHSTTGSKSAGPFIMPDWSPDGNHVSFDCGFPPPTSLPFLAYKPEELPRYSTSTD